MSVNAGENWFQQYGVPTWSPLAARAKPLHVVDSPPRLRHLATDLGNAEAWVVMHADRFRYVKERRTWLHWDNGRWRPDTTGDAERAGKQVARELLRQAADMADDDERKTAVKWALETQSERRIRAMLSLAATEPEIVLSADALDRDPYLLAVANGVVDLKTGQLRRHNPADLISLGTDIPYDPDARAPRWQRYLEESFAGDADLIAFCKRASGYTLTGDTREHLLFVLHGTGCNGKTTYVETMKKILGDFAQTTPFDTLMRARGGRGIPNDVARLHRARLVVAAESGEGRRLDEALVKVLTGGDTVAARFLYSEFFDFRPRFKLWLVTNHRPRVDGDDDAIWRRLRLIPFEVSFEGREDRTLVATLKEELPGILAWAVEGCLEWQREALSAPTAVERATTEYRRDEDVLGSFLAERCVMNGTVEVAELRDAYEQFCREIGEKPLNRSTLGKRLSRRAVTSSTTSRGRVYHGVSLNTD